MAAARSPGQQREEQHADAERPIGIDHAGLLVEDVARALRFYTEVIGCEEVPRPAVLTAPGAWIRVGAQHLHLIGEAESGRATAMNPRYDAEEVAIGYGNHVALLVRSLDAILDRVRHHGLEPSIPLARGDGVRRAFVTDPDGHIVELMETGAHVTGNEPPLLPPRRSRT